MAKTVVGFFDSYPEAQRAQEELIKNGFRRDEVNIITNKERYSEAEHDDVHGAAVGATTGAVVGGAAGLVAAMIPGVGPVLAAGPLIATLVGAGAGAVAGGIIGALVDAGVPEDDAKLYEEGIRRGGTLLMVRADNNIATRAAQIMNQAGAVDIKRRSGEWRTGSKHMAGAQQQQTAQRQTPPQPGQRATQREGEIRVPVVEEELKVGKREVSGEAGGKGVRVQTKVTEKPVEKQVQLHEEHVNVERRPTDRPASPADLSGQKGETFEMREHREEPVVQKTARVVEEVVISKEERDRTEKIRDTVRRKDVEVQPIGAQRGEDDTDYRNNFKTVYANAGVSYEQYAPAYQYGSQLRSNQQYSGRDWNAIETDVRRDWETRNPGSSWDRMKNAVRYGWDRMQHSV